MNENLAYKDFPYLEAWREEQIAGKWIAIAPALVNHNRIKRNITRLFDEYLDGRDCEALPDGTAVYLTETDYYYPDVCVVCDPEKVKEDGIYGPPDLVVEVLSPGTAKYDRGRKMQIYGSSGVREYWLVNPADKVVEQYLPAEGQKGRLELHEVYAVHPECELKRMKPEELAAIRTEFKCSLYDDLIIRLEDIFRRVP